MKTIYVDTSVFGGIYDNEFEEWTGRFFQKVLESNVKIIYSDVAEKELERAPVRVREFVNNIPDNNIIKTSLDDECVLLANKYVVENVVGETSIFDCYHIAMATIYKADLLVSWNFKHIVNIQRIHGYNSVNLKNGYQTVEIRNPREAFAYE